MEFICRRRCCQTGGRANGQTSSAGSGVGMQSSATGDGTHALASDLLFADMRPDAREGVSDCMKVGTQGNVYCGESGGIHVLSPGGERLGIVVHGQPGTTNLCFGDSDRKSVFFPPRVTASAHSESKYPASRRRLSNTAQLGFEQAMPDCHTQPLTQLRSLTGRTSRTTRSWRSWLPHA